MRIWCVWLLFSGLAWGQVLGTVRGIVHDPQHRPIAGAKVTVQAVNSAWKTAGVSNANGEFQFMRVPYGVYLVTAVAKGFAAARQGVSLESGESPILHLELAVAAGSQSITVRAAPAPVANVNSATPTTMVSGTEIARTPGASQVNSLAAITDYVPGAYMVHDQLHVRGGHQVSWLVDGVPVPNTNIASNVGPQFDPNDMDYLEVQRGAYDAEYGDRTYGVFNIVPRTGFERNNEAQLMASAGNYWQSNDELSFGSHTDRFAYFASVSGNRSNLGLETPTAEVLHDADNGAGGFESLIFNKGPRDQLRLVASQRRDFYQIPNTPGQNAAGASFQHDAEQESDALVNFSWVHTVNRNTLLTVSPFYHFNAANYSGSPGDYPISTTDDRGSNYAGAQVTLVGNYGPSNTEAGFYGFGQRDSQTFGLLFNDQSNPDFRQRENAAGQLEDAFLEEKYHPYAWLTLMGGLRQSHFGGNLTENATSPRLGVAVAVPKLGVVLRGSYGRYYQPPPLLTAAGPLLQYVTSQNLGFIPLRGERDEEWEVGMTLPMAGWALDGDYFHNRARNYFDHNNVGNSNVFFPLTISGARIYGFEATLRSPRLWNRGDVHVAFSNQIAEGEGQITGGLTDFSPPTGYFLLDHDQRNTLNAGGDWNFGRGLLVAANFYYGSGFANGNAPPAHLPGNGSLDLSLSKRVNERITLSGTVLNVTDEHLLIDNSLTFGGTHWNDPRQIYGQVVYRFKY